jgi:hypothetical protein
MANLGTFFQKASEQTQLWSVNSTRVAFCPSKTQVFEFRYNLYAEEGRRTVMDARRDTLRAVVRA